MDFEIRTPSILGTGKADKRGVWRWAVPQKLSYGIHTLYVTATDPNDSTNTETSVFKIQVTRSGVEVVRLGLSWILGIIVLAVVGLIFFKRSIGFKKLKNLWEKIRFRK